MAANCWSALIVNLIYPFLRRGPLVCSRIAPLLDAIRAPTKADRPPAVLVTGPASGGGTIAISHPRTDIKYWISPELPRYIWRRKRVVQVRRTTFVLSVPKLIGPKGT